MFRHLARLPGQAWNWDDRATPPSLAEGRAQVAGAVIGGLNQWKTLRDGTPEQAVAEAQDAIAQTGGVGLIIGPGCVLPMGTPDPNVAAVVRALGGPLKRVPGATEGTSDLWALGMIRPVRQAPLSEPQTIRSVILIIATMFPSLNACSFVPFPQVQTWSFLAVKVLPSCTSRSSPSVIWQTMASFIGLPALFDPGCMMMSRIETLLKPGMMAGPSP